VIPGTEALQLMSVGSKWKLYVPYNLAMEKEENQGQVLIYFKFNYWDLNKIT